MTKIHGDPFHHVDYNAMVDGINQNGVLSGLAVSQHAAGADMSVDVAAGSALIDEEKYIESSITNLAIDASESGKHRKDTIIYDTSAGTPAVIKGTSVVITSAAAPPSVTDGDILLAVVYIGDSVTEITDSVIYDGRIIVSAIKDNWTATTDPDNNDDTDSGYEIGSRWVNTAKRSFFVCTDATAGAAVWRGTYSTASAPTATDDDAHGFTIGSRWINTTTNQEFVCLDATTSNAVWIETTSQLQEDFLEIIRQMHPNVSVLAAMDESTYNAIYKDGTNYILGSIPLTQTSNDGETYIYGANYEAQTFTPDTDIASLISIDLYMHTYNGQLPEDDLYVDLYVTDTSGHPNGSSLASGTLTAFADNTWHWKNVVISYNVQKDVKYALVFSSPSTSASTKSYCIRDNSGGGISNGNRESSTDSGSTWTTQTEDYAIKINNVAGALTGDIISDALVANADVLSFYSHLKGKFSNGDSTASDPVEVEIYGNGDSYASPLNGTTKLKMDPSDPIIELYRIDDSVVAKSDAQTDWVLDDNSTNGASPAKTTSTHETILAEEIGCAAVVMVEKSVNGGFTDTELLVEDDDYTIDYSTRTATKIILTTSAAADIVNAQSKLRITWIVDVENIDGTANTALKMKIYLNRTDTTEASPEIQPIDLGTGKYAEMKYMCG